MANQITNLVLTQIAGKRLSGKAHTNANLEISGEPLGSTVQTLGSTVFGQGVPNNPDNTWSTHQFLIQSSSTSDPGTVQLVEFEISTASFGTYQNDTSADAGEPGGDEGETQIDTFHAFALRLTGSYEGEPANNLNTNASTNTSLGSAPFANDYHLSGSRGRLQIVPEYASNLTAGIGGSNPYTPVLLASDGATISPDSDIDWYLDPYAGILFIQDPVDFTTGNSSLIPDKIRAFIYTGKYQDQISGGDTVDLHISASAGTGFSLGNSATASFVSGTAGISVTAGSPNTITIGSANDNVTFNNITASIINADKIEATEYIVSSSITYMTQSFSSGSTIFGDTNDDTHQFTGSISILHTGSTYGFQMSGSNFLIDYGNSGSVTLGEHNIGKEFLGLLFPITGSGLIISQSFTDEATHHNMVKIGETELVDISGSTPGVGVNDSFFISTPTGTTIISSSLLDKPVAEFANANHKLYSSSTAFLDIANQNLSLQPTNNLNLNAPILNARVRDAATYGNPDTYFFGTLSSPNAIVKQVFAFSSSQMFQTLGGAITASAVSSSGLLFANLSGNPTHNDGILAIVYDTGSGQFYYTGSYGAGGGDTTDLEASASQGIYFWTGSAEGTSIGLMQTASFTSNGAGLSVDLDESTNTFTYTLTPQDVFDAFDTANTGSFTASYANTASKIVVTNTVASTNYGLVLNQNTGSTPLYSDTASLYYNPGNETLTLEGTIPSVIVVSSSNILDSSVSVGPNYVVSKHYGTNKTFSLITSAIDKAEIINFGTNTETINVGTGSGTVYFAGSASIEGDLTVKGAVTSIETTNLNVTDQFILLKSGSNTGDGGIIIQTGDGGGTPNGPALFLDNNVTRFAVAKGIPWNQTSDITQDNNSTMQYIVTITSSNGAPTAGTLEWGTGGAASAQYGNMYVDESTGDIYIYGG